MRVLFSSVLWLALPIVIVLGLSQAGVAGLSNGKQDPAITGNGFRPLETETNVSVVPGDSAVISFRVLTGHNYHGTINVALDPKTLESWKRWPRSRPNDVIAADDDVDEDGTTQEPQGHWESGGQYSKLRPEVPSGGTIDRATEKHDTFAISYNHAPGSVRQHNLIVFVPKNVLAGVQTGHVLIFDDKTSYRVPFQVEVLTQTL